MRFYLQATILLPLHSKLVCKIENSPLYQFVNFFLNLNRQQKVEYFFLRIIL